MKCLQKRSGGFATHLCCPKAEHYVWDEWQTYEHTGRRVLYNVKWSEIQLRLQTYPHLLFPPAVLKSRWRQSWNNFFPTVAVVELTRQSAQCDYSSVRSFLTTCKRAVPQLHHSSCTSHALQTAHSKAKETSVHRLSTSQSKISPPLNYTESSGYIKKNQVMERLVKADLCRRDYLVT